MARAKVLIVEDEVIVAEVLSEQLTSMGYDVCPIALTGSEALTLVNDQHPDVILMDIQLGQDMDGIETAGRVHTQFGIPIIYLTAYSDENTLKRAKIAEPFGYLLKPYTCKELHATIEMALHKDLKEREQAEESRDYLSGTVRHQSAAINQVLSASESLADDELNMDQQDYVNTISESGESLLSMMSDILDFSQKDKDKRTGPAAD